MRKWSKALAIILCAICLVTASVMITIAAIMVKSEPVKNTFVVGKIGLTLDESDVDELGEPIEGADPVTENTYKLYADRTYQKDPVVHIAANSEDCYVFIKIDNEIANIESDEEPNIDSQIKDNGWTAMENGVYYQTYTSNEEQVDLKVFEQFAIGTVNYDELLTYENKSIIIMAYAVQTEEFTPQSAWEMIDTEYGVS